MLVMQRDRYVFSLFQMIDGDEILMELQQCWVDILNTPPAKAYFGKVL